jgi:hypothetical protein
MRSTLKFVLFAVVGAGVALWLWLAPQVYLLPYHHGGLMRWVGWSGLVLYFLGLIAMYMEKKDYFAPQRKEESESFR